MRNFASLGLNYRHPFCALVFLVIALCTGSVSGHAQNLERYTQVDASTVRRETGQLGDDGVFTVLTSSESSLGVAEAFLAQLAPLNGRVIMDAMMFDALKTAGIIPNWVRSTRVYRIGISDYVIVCIQRVCDPNAPPARPDLTRQPQSLSLIEGEPGVFSVEATGTAPLHYQWRKDGIPIAGANQSAWNLLAVGPADAGQYDVVVTNVFGTKTSAVAMLTVTPPPPTTVLMQQSGLSGFAGKHDFWNVTVPPGYGTLIVRLSGGTGDADLHLEPDVQPPLFDFSRPTTGVRAIGRAARGSRMATRKRSASRTRPRRSTSFWFTILPRTAVPRWS